MTPLHMPRPCVRSRQVGAGSTIAPEVDEQDNQEILI